jgi:hypothetical protein
MEMAVTGLTFGARRALPGILFLSTFIFPHLAMADLFSFTGTFDTDDQVQLFNFTVDTTTEVMFQTWGYGGGTNAANQTIQPDGFESLLDWFGPDGSYINNSSSCGAGNSFQGACLDAYGDVTLDPGTYTLALTQEGNSANCAAGFPGDLDCGFSEQGQGAYTPGATGDPDCTGFCGSLGTQENGNWAVDISGADSASAVSSSPEPVTMLLGACGLALIGLAKLRRQGRHS